MRNPYETNEDMQFTVPLEERVGGIENKYFGDPSRNEAVSGDRNPGRAFANADVKFYMEAYEDARQSLVADMSVGNIAAFLEAEARKTQMLADLGRHSEFNADINHTLRVNASELLHTSNLVATGIITKDNPAIIIHIEEVLSKH